MIRRPPRSTLSSSSAASDVYKRQVELRELLIIQAESPPSLHEHLGERPHLRDVQPAVVRGVGGPRPADCIVPGLMEALNPREDESHGSTEEVPGGASGAGGPDGGGRAA